MRPWLRILWIFAGSAVFVGLVVGHARGAGFQVSEQSVVGLARAFAGAGVVGDDLSAVFYNPAAKTLLHGTAGQAGVTFVLPSAVFHGMSTRVPIGGGMSAQYASVSLSRAVFTGAGDGLAKVSGTD